MPHARTLIRNAVATLLRQEIATPEPAWALVYESRIDYPRDVWPYLKVYADREDTARLSIHSPHTQERTLSLNIVGMIKVPAGETESVEDKMDQFAVLIERYLTDDEVRGELTQITVVDLQTTSMDVMLTTEDKVSHAELSMNFSIKYCTLEGVPDAFI